jgi:hypothetical protein
MLLRTHADTTRMVGPAVGAINGCLHYRASLYPIQRSQMSTYVLLVCGFGTGLAIAIWGIFDTLKYSRRQSREYDDHTHSTGDNSGQ